MIDALVKHLGVVTLACKEVGISRTQHYNWYNKDKKYRKAVDDVGDVTLDFAESMLHKQIQDKDTTATIFFLKTKGKKRGYVERSELEHSGIPTQVQVEVTDPRIGEELKKLLQ